MQWFGVLSGLLKSSVFLLNDHASAEKNYNSTASFFQDECPKCSMPISIQYLLILHTYMANGKGKAQIEHVLNNQIMYNSPINI